MDWAKAKTVLIIAFLITNVFLGYNLYTYKTNSNKNIYFQKESFDSLKNLLKEKNISIDCEIPKNTPSLSTISVRYENFRNDLLKTHAQKHGKVKILEDKKIIYQTKMKLSKFDKNEALSKTEYFLKSFNLDKDVQLKYVNQTKDYIEVRYTNKYKGYFLEESYMSYVYYKNNDFYFERLWLLPMKENHKKRRIITSVEAIMAIYNKLDENSKIEEIKLGYITRDPRVKMQSLSKIEEINQGYHFKDKNNVNLQKAKIITALPTWRIKTHDKYYYVHAFDF